MTSYSASLDLESALSVPTRCPGCSAPGMRPVVDGEQTLFRCVACATTWHIELGWVTPVTPVASRAVQAGTHAAETPRNVTRAGAGSVH